MRLSDRLKAVVEDQLEREGEPLQR
ncbi:MAG: hypothetical protein H6R33_791, partial [Actinobacteria bacterium]|nr:hypothetical protein [Actinomycetota bacterium]